MDISSGSKPSVHTPRAQASIALIASNSYTMQMAYFIFINNNAPHVSHEEKQRLPCYVSITSFYMMGDITLILIPGSTSAA